MITDMNARVAMAQKLSIPQLQQAIKNGTIPAYVGVPLLQDKMRQQQQMQMAQQGQQGQQQQRPIAEEVMEQAGAMGGVDQLPSNLPIQNEEDEENYAGGGIIAFRDGNQVQDPALRSSPDMDPDYTNSYRSVTGYETQRDHAYDEFVKAGGLEGDTSKEAYYSLGNRDPLNVGLDAFSYDVKNRTGQFAQVEPQAEPQTAPPKTDGRRLNFNQATNPETASDQEAIKNQLRQAWAASQDIGSIGVRGLGTAADYFNRGLRAIGVPESVAPRLPGEYTFNRSSQGLTPYTDRLRTANVNETIDSGMAFNLKNPAPPETPPNVDTGMFSGVDLTGADELPPKAPAQRGAPPPSATSSGAVSPATARQISATNPGAPATLKDAERQAASGSPQASAAVSMLDRYVAMLEKSGDDVGRQKKEALYMALIQGGLGMMGGTSPNAFANISAGLLPATQAYQQAIAGIRKDDRARLEKLLSAGLKKEEFLLKAKEIGINQQKADNWYEVMTNRNAAMAARGGDSTKQARLFAYNAGRDLSRVEGDVTKLKNTDEYKEAARILSMPYDPKKVTPSVKQMRERAQSVVDSVNQEALRRVNDARGAVDFYRTEAGLPPLYSSDTGSASGGNVPTISSQADYAKLPKGAKYKDPNGVLRTKG